MGERYYWLKLKEDFFQTETIEWLEEQTNGEKYVLFYLKLCLKSLKQNGILIRQIGEVLVPYDLSKLAEMTRTDIDTARVAMDVLIKIGLVEIQENGQLFMKCLGELVGSESATKEAVKKRKYRAKLDKINLGDILSLEMSPDCPLNCPTEYRDKSIEIRDKDIKKKYKKEKPPRHKYGEYNNVLLSDKDMEKLKSEYPTDWQERIDTLSYYMKSKNKSYTDHLATIRAWARKERKQAEAAKPKDDFADMMLGTYL